MFQGAGGRRPQGEDAAPLGLGPVDRVGGLRRNDIALLMHPMFEDIVHTHRQERAQSHVQSHRMDLHSPAPQTLEGLRREMQTGRGRGHRAGGAGEDGLITFPIGRIVLPPDVGGQRDAAHPFESRGEIAGAGKTDMAVGSFATGQDGSLDFAAEQQPGARSGRFGTFGQTRPVLPIRGQATDQEHLDLATAALFAEQPRRNHPGIVEYQQIPGPEILTQILEGRHPDIPLPTTQDQQAGIFPMGPGILGNESFG